MPLVQNHGRGLDGSTEFQAAWEKWIATEADSGHLRRESSAAVYRDMWFSLGAWCQARQLPLANLSTAALDHFLEVREGRGMLSERYAWRFLRLVDRVLTCVSPKAGAMSPAAVLLEQRPEYRYANASDKDQLPSFLAPEQAQSLVDFLSAGDPPTHQADTKWQDVRNRTSVGLMLGAGLTPAEVRALTLEHVVQPTRNHAPWRLRVTAQPDTPAHEAPLAPWAAATLSCWLEKRAAIGIPGPWVFPSTGKGTAWSKVSHYNATKQVLATAGIQCEDGGSYQLRHTFALRQLGKGTAPTDVARWLGVTDPDVMARYQRVLAAFVEVI
jgi:integrase